VEYYYGLLRKTTCRCNHSNRPIMPPKEGLIVDESSEEEYSDDSEDTSPQQRNTPTRDN